MSFGSNSNRRVWSVVFAAGLAVSAIGASALAQADAGKPAADPALKGPSVTDRNVPGVEGMFGEGGGEKKKMVNEQRLPPRVFRDAMETIMGPDAPEGVRVSDEQRTRFEGWFQDFQKSQREYMQSHKTELNALRPKAGEFNKPKKPGQPPQPPQPPAGGDQMSPPNAADEKSAIEAREKYKAIMDGSPKIEDVYTKVWTELNTKQREAVDGRIAEFRAEQSKDRQENYVKQKLGKKGKQPDGAGPPPGGRPNGGPEGGPRPPRGQNGQRPGGPNGGPDGGPRGGPDGGQPGGPDGQRGPGPRGQGGPGGPGGPRQGPDGARIDPQRRDRIMQLLGRMTPEQQDQLIERIEQRMRDAGMDPNAGPGGPQRGPGGPGGPGQQGGPRGDRRGPGRDGAPKPPPEMDELDVPPPPPPAQEQP